MCYFWCLTTWDKCCSPPLVALGKLIFSWDSLCQLMKEAALNGSSNDRTQMVHCHAPGEQPGGIPLSLICTQGAENRSLPWGSPFTSTIPQGHPAHLNSALVLDSRNTQRSCHECFTKEALVWIDLGNLNSLEDKCTHIFVCVGHQELLTFFIHALYWFVEKIGVAVVLQQRNLVKTVGKLETDLLLLHWKYSRCVSKTLTPAPSRLVVWYKSSPVLMCPVSLLKL